MVTVSCVMFLNSWAMCHKNRSFGVFVNSLAMSIIITVTCVISAISRAMSVMITVSHLSLLTDDRCAS